MPSYTAIDYATAFFPIPVLPRIVGKPTYEKLREMKKALKANAASVQSDLGGGAFGHLGLVLDDVTYNTLTGHNYVRPVHPGALIIAAGTPHHEAVRLREEQAENIRIFRETVDVNNALIKQITNTIENDYIKELYNNVTSTITRTIPEVLTFLFTRYGEVTSERVTQEETKVRSFTWNLTDPPIVIFNLIEDLETISEAANIPKTSNQLISYGLDIVRATGEFENALITWFNRPTAQKTWDEFKTHFTQAHTELSRVRGSTMQGSVYHQANATIAALGNEIASIRTEVIDSINSLSVRDPSPSSDQHMLATVSNQTALISAIQDLQSQIRDLAAINNSISNNRSTNNSNRWRRQNRSKYCWTHGACAHSSRECNSPAEGHQNEATFEDKMGGSNAYCGNRS